MDEKGELVKDQKTIAGFKHRDRKSCPIQNESPLSEFYKNEFFRLCRGHASGKEISEASENLQRCSSPVNAGVTYGRFLEWLEETGLSMRQVKSISGRDMRRPLLLEEKIFFTELDLKNIASLAR